MRLVGIGPSQSHGGPLRVGSMLRGLGTGIPGRTHKQQEPQSKCQFGSSENPSVRISRGAPGSWGVTCPSAYKVLKGRPEGARQSHTLIAERSSRLGRHRGVWKGGLETCAHVCTHVHAYGAHTCTHSRARASTGTLACTQPTHVAPKPGSDMEVPTATGAQQSTGTPSVEKIMPVVGS